MWVSLLLGCFNGQSRSYDAYLLERDAVADTSSTFTACSMPVGNPRRVLFANNQDFAAQLYFIEPDCTGSFTTTVQPGGSTEQTTLEGDVWRFRDAAGGPYIAEVVVDDLSIYYELLP